MPSNRRNLLAASGNSGTLVYVEDVFSTYLYTGNGSTQTITNGIDLDGEGGLVWMKGRSGATDHALYDTARGATKDLVSNSTAAETTQAIGLTAFSGTGFSIGALAKLNTNAATYASWTFRKQAKFFDVVTYTGTGVNRTVAHDLGSVPGMIIVKRTDTTGDWQVYHRSLANTEYLVLNSNAAKATGATRWNSTTPTSTVFSLGTDATVNASGGTYVAYIFAHDAGGFGDDGSESIIKCGSYTGTGAAGLEVDLGFEPQWLLIKNSDRAISWHLTDSMRGLNVTSRAELYPNLSNAEWTGSPAIVSPTSTGFVLGASNTYTNFSGEDFIYIAIRRPMKTPESGTEVFAPFAQTTAAPTILNTNFDVDLLWWKNNRTVTGRYFYSNDRLRGNYKQLRLHDTVAEQAQADPYVVGFDYSDKIVENLSGSGQPAIYYAFKRATGFFDVVAYSGQSTALTVNHNLKVAPELIIIKNRTDGVDWWHVGSTELSNTSGWDKYLRLNETSAEATINYWESYTPTASNFKVRGGTGPVNDTGKNYIAYLFATLAGVSKVGSYTGTGTTQVIDCGFTAGARFVMIKRTDSTGDWYVWDSARGITAGNDPYLLLNSTAAEVTGTDYIDPSAAGFEISSTAPAAINASGGSFIYLAVA